MSRAERLYASPHVEIAAASNLMLVVWHESPTVGVMRELFRAGRELARQHPKGSGLMNVFLGGTPRFNEELRQETVKIDRDPLLFSLGIARVFLMPSLAGMVVRSFLNTVSMGRGKSARPVHAFAGVREAAAWLAPKLEVGGQRWSAADIVALAAPLVESAAAMRA